MMESVVEGQDRVAEILAERETELAEARKERVHREEALQQAEKTAALQQTTILGLQNELR